jgi:hypothetical protein
MHGVCTGEPSMAVRAGWNVVNDVMYPKLFSFIDGHPDMKHCSLLLCANISVELYLFLRSRTIRLGT